MKNKVFIFWIIIMLCFSACAANEAESKTYTYEEVSSKQQAIVDSIYENYGSWGFVWDTGQKVPVTKINFLYEDGVLLFITYYDEDNDGIAYFCAFREVGENGELTMHAYENTLFNQNERTKERNAEMAGITGFLYPRNVDEQKDVLANALYQVQEDK